MICVSVLFLFIYLFIYLLIIIIIIILFCFWGGRGVQDKLPYSLVRIGKYFAHIIYL